MKKEIKAGTDTQSSTTDQDKHVSSLAQNPVLPAVFQKELNKLAKLNAAYKNQLEKVVDGIENVFGYSPYDVDCDDFIDTFCTGSGNMSINNLNERMSDCVVRNGR